MTSIDRHLDAYKRVLKLLTDNEYDFIHCHSPIGGVIARLAAHKRKRLSCIQLMVSLLPRRHY